MSPRDANRFVSCVEVERRGCYVLAMDDHFCFLLSGGMLLMDLAFLYIVAVRTSNGTSYINLHLP